MRGILDEDKTIQIRYCPYCGAKLVTTRYLTDLLRKRKELEKAIKSSKKYYSSKEIQDWMNAPLGKRKQ